ncbi:peptidase S8/S53 domain-containing protein [Parachaetomium inaequale]|uniref:Peptidase S8/S53 domain-containing protein n=1 Tax=Parachaetomium inaequale TaxID=2588326 RepID=A0AAN6PD85_9PEZI|nr:peptidase S8/S53 domain-containing protein [Parachaetomium inaequale]
MHWFQLLDEKVYPILAKRRRAGDRAVKVAVLDTGINLTHERIQSHLDRHGSKIINCQDWTASQHGTDDRIGHGTAVCDVLLRTAKVHLYVGKVSDEAAFDKNVPARVAQVTPDGWNVDIIVLSLGFESEDKGIRDAICDASNKNVVILAAASNSGSIDSTKRVSFPARIHGRVIAVRSATGFGRRADSSPGRSDGDDNFAILGEGIEAAWPQHLNDGRPTRFVSGTSYATPLAAGVAALIMEFSIQKDKRGPNLKKEALDVLMSYRGVRKMFEFMSATQDNSVNVDCRMISPWRLFDPEMAYEGLAHVIEHQLKNAS